MRRDMTTIELRRSTSVRDSGVLDNLRRFGGDETKKIAEKRLIPNAANEGL